MKIQKFWLSSLNPILGYEVSSLIAREALLTGKSVHEIAVLERGLLSQAKWEELFSVENLIRPKFINT